MAAAAPLASPPLEPTQLDPAGTLEGEETDDEVVTEGQPTTAAKKKSPMWEPNEVDCLSLAALAVYDKGSLTESQRGAAIAEQLAIKVGCRSFYCSQIEN